jgi:hypothetical protein
MDPILPLDLVGVRKFGFARVYGRGNVPDMEQIGRSRETLGVGAIPYQPLADARSYDNMLRVDCGMSSRVLRSHHIAPWCC